MASIIEIAPGQRLGAVVRERHVRRDRAYLVEDKNARVLYIGQKLAPLVDQLNKAVEHHADRISLSGVYQNMGDLGARNGGYAKHRFRCEPVPLDRAGEALDRARHRATNCFVVGDPSCYRFQPLTA
ncbi:MAG: hypothetical protein ACO32I_09370 [Candidatus Limnocylindrus sp.]